MTSVAQAPYLAQDGDAMFQLRIERDPDGVQVLSIAQSRNGGESYVPRVRIPLADAIEFAKTMVRFAVETVEAGETDEAAQMHADLDAILSRQAEEDAYIERMWEHEQARRYTHDGYEADVEFDEADGYEISTQPWRW